MSSRTDGGGGIDAPRPGGLDVGYSRYTERDARCCPLSTVDLRFTIEPSDAGPVLTPQAL